MSDHQSAPTTIDSEVDGIFSRLNGSGAHACYCERSTDGGCKCALNDEYLVEAKTAITNLVAQEANKARVDEHNLVFAKTGELNEQELAFWSAERLEDLERL